MSALTRLPRIATITSLGALLTLFSTSSSARMKLIPYLPSILVNNNGFPWRLLAFALALLNIKSLPFVWHLRVFRAMLYQLYFQPTKLPPDALFKPMITRISRNSMLECDWNLHKSNSTYFADLDVARSQLISCLLRKGIRTQASQKRERRDPGDGAYLIALGGVTCQFKREVKPFESFDSWTRVLSWDRKWIYLVTHLVKPGTVKPSGWDLQPWKRAGKRKTAEGGEANGHVVGAPGRREEIKKRIFATSISKYVVKKGRFTIAPELVLQRSDLLPPKPEGAPPPSELAKAAALNVEDLRDGAPSLANNSWTWELVEIERLRGLQLAEQFGALDGLHDEFPSAGQNPDLDDVEVLGSYGDFLW